MWKRMGHIFVAELLAFGAFVTGGLAVLGASMTLSGASRHASEASWLLVALFGAISLAFLYFAIGRARRVFARTE